MLPVNIHQLRAQLSRYIERVEKGETILLCRRNRPVAELRPVRKQRRARRPIGLAKGRFEVPASFFEPLPDELIRAFEGRDA